MRSLRGTEGWVVHLNWPLHETVVLPIVEETFPEWRRVANEHQPDVADNISLTSDTLTSMAGLCNLHKGYSIDLKLGGNLGVIDWTLGPLHGLLMPARPASPPMPDNEAERT